jgi:hypothetical protein
MKGRPCEFLVAALPLNVLKESHVEVLYKNTDGYQGVETYPFYRNMSVYKVVYDTEENAKKGITTIGEGKQKLFGINIHYFTKPLTGL